MIDSVRWQRDKAHRSQPHQHSSGAHSWACALVFYELVVASCGGAEAWDSNTGSFSIDPDYSLSLSMRLEQMGLPREAPCPQGACVLGLEGLDRACSMGLVASLDLVNLAAVMNSPSEIAVKAKLQHLAKDNASKAIPIYSHYVCMYVYI